MLGIETEEGEVEISIHAPRGGSDLCWPKAASWHTDFNPRSPWGERPQECYISISSIVEFQSTLPVGGATINDLTGDITGKFQSTLPVGGATRNAAT